jgi:hypothetical protein
MVVVSALDLLVALMLVVPALDRLVAQMVVVSAPKLAACQPAESLQ